MSTPANSGSRPICTEAKGKRAAALLAAGMLAAALLVALGTAWVLVFKLNTLPGRNGTIRFAVMSSVGGVLSLTLAMSAAVGMSRLAGPRRATGPQELFDSIELLGQLRKKVWPEQLRSPDADIPKKRDDS